MNAPKSTLSQAKLNAMIAHAVSHPQLPAHAGAQVISLHGARGALFSSGLAALAASIILAIGLLPQSPSFSQTAAAEAQPSTAMLADLTDLSDGLITTSL